MKYSHHEIIDIICPVCTDVTVEEVRHNKTIDLPCKDDCSVTVLMEVRSPDKVELTYSIPRDKMIPIDNIRNL